MTTVEVVCYKYKPLKNGELPLKIRVCKDRKIKYVNLGVSTKKEHWDFEKNAPAASCPNRELIEKLIANKVSEIKSQIVEFKVSDKDYSANTLVEKVSGTKKTIGVAALFAEHIRVLEEEKRTGYLLSIRQTFNSLVLFNKHLNIPFSDIDCLWLKRYELWLRKQRLSENTIGIRFRNLRVIFNLALEYGYVKDEDYPFRRFKVSRLHEKTAKRALSKEDVM